MRNLGHLVVPRESAGQMLLHTAREKREQSVEIAVRDITAYFPHLPTVAVQSLAERIVTDIDIET